MKSICNDCLLKDYCFWSNKVNFVDCEMRKPVGALSEETENLTTKNEVK